MKSLIIYLTIVITVAVVIPIMFKDELVMDDTGRDALFDVTAYCSCEKCCGKYADGITASGHKIQAGDRFVAADAAIAFGTLVSVPDYAGGQPVPVLDRGGAIKGNRIDVYFDDKDGVSGHQRALNFGRQLLKVRIIKCVKQ